MRLVVLPARFRYLLAVLILCMFSVRQDALADSSTGQVIGVSDGDTIKLLLPGDVQEKVRLYGIDCPEKKQPFGTRAKQFTSDMVFGKVVEVERVDRDRYGRTIGWVNCNGRSLNRELLKAGLAWHYRQYSSDASLARLELSARKRRVGLWLDPHPIAPWDWRRAKRK